jgi:hypothetical protein
MGYGIFAGEFVKTICPSPFTIHHSPLGFAFTDLKCYIYKRSDDAKGG